VTDDERNAAYIVPSVFHPDVSAVVAAAVHSAARAAVPRQPIAHSSPRE
jgi:malate dehydrogenase (oxaloacetate-decarboxylating)